MPLYRCFRSAPRSLLSIALIAPLGNTLPAGGRAHGAAASDIAVQAELAAAKALAEAMVAERNAAVDRQAELECRLAALQKQARAQGKQCIASFGESIRGPIN